jgi:chitin-binding protein
LAAAFSALLVGPAQAHGSMQKPVSRTYECFLENPEHPTSNACKAAVALGGTQPFYDWNEVNLLNADGQHHQLIPDGKLCSAGRAKYQGFDLAGADWPTTTLPASGSYTFQYKAPVPHRGTFFLYVTKNGYDPTKPLKWSDLEDKPFLRATDPPLRNGSYIMPGTLPAGHPGRQLIYSIWQRSDSPEAFYTCSDVVLGKDIPLPGPAVSPTRTPTRTPTIRPPATCAAPVRHTTTGLTRGHPVSSNQQTWTAER